MLFHKTVGRRPPLWTRRSKISRRSGRFHRPTSDGGLPLNSGEERGAKAGPIRCLRTPQGAIPLTPTDPGGRCPTGWCSQPTAVGDFPLSGTGRLPHPLNRTENSAGAEPRPGCPTARRPPLPRRLKSRCSPIETPDRALWDDSCAPAPERSPDPEMNRPSPLGETPPATPTSCLFP